jgi:hypothetical protein
MIFEIPIKEIGIWLSLAGMILVFACSTVVPLILTKRDEARDQEMAE